MFKNVKKEEITIPAQMSYLIQVREFIEHIGKKYKFHDKIVNSFKLVVDEACTNIIRHGYRDIKNGEITIKAIIRRLSLTMIIIDQGQSYDPRQANTPDLAKYVDIGKKGGLGILMMRKLMDDMQYTVTERGNEFRLTKYREVSHENPILQKWNALNLKTKYTIYAVLIFTLLAFLIFLPIYWDTEENIRQEVFSLTSAGAKSLAGNLMDDLLEENDAVLFENAFTLKSNIEKYAKEVFIVDSTGHVLAWGDPSKVYDMDIYRIPEKAVQVDTLNQTQIFQYGLNDSLNLYDIQSNVLLGGVKKIGEVHVWVDQRTIDDLVFQRKIRLIIYLLIILILGYIPLFFLISKILAPFHHLAVWVRDVIHGKIDQDEIDIDASDEIGEIAQAFNEMTNKFHEAQVTLMEQQKLQKELQVAQEIQQMLLPSDFPQVEGFEIASYYEAAKEVGGDLFDFVEVDDDTVGIIVADVSGKGVPGSLIMTMIRTAIRLESRGNKNPADVLARVNQFVADDMKRGMFVTMFYVILDSRERIIHYASAGHNPMILYRGSTKQTYYLNPTGFPVGIQLPDLELFAKTIKSESIRLREDDILVLYTDGITEAMNSKRELYREERFLDSIRRNAHLDVGEFVEAINRELKQFTGGAPQNDDITFVAIREKMMSSEVKYKVQQELFQMIESGMKVKDALKKLRVSPHQYYRYKEIINRKGMDGLREYFEDQDIVEKKHLSLEVKTKIFDIIRKHPDYGPKLISYELRKDEYGNVRIDPDRIYDELVRLRLNTQKLRERYLAKGEKRRIKQPGTPLLTLDGKVILDFESTEQEIAKRRATTQTAPAAKSRPATMEEKKTTSLHLTTEQKAKPTYLHKPAKTFSPEQEKKVEAKEAKEPQTSAEPVRKEEPKPARRKKLVTLNEKAVSKDELLQRAMPALDQEKISEFYQKVSDDFSTTHTLLSNLKKSENALRDLKQVNLVLKISLKHPILKELPDVKKVFSQIQELLDSIIKHFDTLEIEWVNEQSKELLKYFKKDHKFKNYNSIFEAINSIGWIHKELLKRINGDEKTDKASYAKIREKLADKKILSDASLLESIGKQKEK